MAQDLQQSFASAARDGARRGASDASFFGIPIGQLGWFSSLLIGLALGFAAFFLATFLGIVGLLVANASGHPLDYALSYRRIGLPVGLGIGVCALAYLGFNWIRRAVTRKA